MAVSGGQIYLFAAISTLSLFIIQAAEADRTSFSKFSSRACNPEETRGAGESTGKRDSANGCPSCGCYNRFTGSKTFSNKDVMKYEKAYQKFSAQQDPEANEVSNHFFVEPRTDGPWHRDKAELGVRESEESQDDRKNDAMYVFDNVGRRFSAREYESQSLKPTSTSVYGGEGAELTRNTFDTMDEAEKYFEALNRDRKKREGRAYDMGTREPYAVATEAGNDGSYGNGPGGSSTKKYLFDNMEEYGKYKRSGNTEDFDP